MAWAAAGLCAVAAAAAPPASGQSTRSCAAVVNPYPNTRFEGVNLRRIRATGVSCATARRVARGAHRRALSLPVPAGGVRRFTFAGWRITGDVRGMSDHYVARRGAARITWLF